MGGYTSLNYHIVFGTKYRRRLVTRDLQERCYEYLGGTIRGLSGHLIQIGGIEDHVHLLVQLPPTITVSNAVRDIKANSSKQMKEISRATNEFEWQVGYSAFTVSISQVETVTKYLERQEEHHRHQTFEEEYIAFLKRHQIQFRRDQLFEGEFAG
jgi:REP element-mobilizing transposase RayT